MEKISKTAVELNELKEHVRKINEGFDLFQDTDGEWHISTINFQYPYVAIHFFGLCGYNKVLLSQHRGKAFFPFPDIIPTEQPEWNDPINDKLNWPICNGCFLVASLFFNQHKTNQQLWTPTAGNNVIKFRNSK